MSAGSNPAGALLLGALLTSRTPRDTVGWEVLEETGVTVEPGQLTGVYKNMRLGVVSLFSRAAWCRTLLSQPRRLPK